MPLLVLEEHVFNADGIGNRNELPSELENHDIKKW
jgi:hypothetical protein